MYNPTQFLVLPKEMKYAKCNKTSSLKLLAKMDKRLEYAEIANKG
jgi:hypothetical protein